MRWLFFIPLTTGILSGYVSYYLKDEIAYLTGAFSILSLIVCLFIAPWQLQLVILILVLLTVRLLWVKVNQRTETDNPNLPEMVSNKLEVENFDQKTYRGIAYSSEKTEEVTKTEQKRSGTYRGLPWQKEQTNVLLTPESKSVKKYRGVPVVDPQSPQGD